MQINLQCWWRPFGGTRFFGSLQEHSWLNSTNGLRKFFDVYRHQAGESWRCGGVQRGAQSGQAKVHKYDVPVREEIHELTFRAGEACMQLTFIETTIARKKFGMQFVKPFIWASSRRRGQIVLQMCRNGQRDQRPQSRREEQGEDVLENVRSHGLM